MNQILSEESPQNRKKRGSKASIHSILVTFAIILIIFGIGLTATGVYSHFKNANKDPIEGLIDNSNAKPDIYIIRENANTINIEVTHTKEISKVTYTINDQEPVEIETNNELKVNKTVTLPAGNIKLTIIAEDINGIKSSRETSYEIEAGPVIEFEKVETKIQVTTTSEINIDTIKYYWDEDEENAEEFTINDLKNVTQIDVIEGNHTLVVKAKDINGNETTKTQKVVGDTKPTLNVTTDGEKFYIKAEDDEGLDKIQYQLNSGEVITEQIDNKEYSKEIELEEGKNKLLVRVYNKNQIAETAKVKYVKE